MSSIAIFKLPASVCALAAAIFLFDQYLYRPCPDKLAWTFGLLCCAIAATREMVGRITVRGGLTLEILNDALDGA
jgi:hypothetical protein